MAHSLTIGKLAKKAQISIDSIRFYERRGLIAEPERTKANYRLYPVEAVDRLRFIKKAQQLGFSLNEIHELMDLSQAPEASKADVKKKTREKIRDVEAKIQDLSRILMTLQELDKRCDGHGPISECPILKSLSEDERKSQL